MGSQHHFVVCFDTDTQEWSFDYEAIARFPDGTIWIKDEANPDGGEWVKYSDSDDDQENKKVSLLDDYLTGSLLGMLMIKNDLSSGVPENLL